MSNQEKEQSPGDLWRGGGAVTRRSKEEGQYPGNRGEAEGSRRLEEGNIVLAEDRRQVHAVEEN